MHSMTNVRQLNETPLDRAMASHALARDHKLEKESRVRYKKNESITKRSSKKMP